MYFSQTQLELEQTYGKHYVASEHRLKARTNVHLGISLLNTRSLTTSVPPEAKPLTIRESCPGDLSPAKKIPLMAYPSVFKPVCIFSWILRPIFRASQPIHASISLLPLLTFGLTNRTSSLGTAKNPPNPLPTITLSPPLSLH